MSQAINRAEVERIARLARLALTEEEAERLTRDLQSILEHFSVLQSVNTKDVPPAADFSGLKNVTRPDAAQPDELCSSAALLELAPQKHDGHFKVKAVF